AFVPESERCGEACAPIASLALAEPLAQHREPTLQPALHSRQRHAARGRDVARCLAFEEAFPDRVAVRSVQRIDRCDQTVRDLGARDAFGVILGRIRRPSRGPLLVADTPRLRAAQAERDVAQDRGEPAADAFVMPRWAAERSGPRLL